MTLPPHPSPTGAPFVARLDALARSDLARGGGKAANLGELIRGGFRVPPGFVVTTLAYDRFVTHNALADVIAHTLRQTPGDGAAIRAAFEAAPIPDDVAQAVRAAYAELGQGPVAVRSSATAEDLAEAAFAGQQDTYLNVVGPEAVLNAVRRCWASLWTDRAIAYRDRQGVDQGTVKLAAVVQALVPAEVAGVMFTANPVTGARNEVVIEGSPGLGEAVVSGQVTPDHYTLRRGWLGWRITERQAGRREVVIRPRAGGGVEHSEGEPAAGEAALPDRAVYALARVGVRIQQHFGSPQDIEWAWANGELYILQARPMTALPPPPPRPNRVIRMLAGNFAELFMVRPYPLDMTAWIPALAGAVEPIFHLLGAAWRLNDLFETEDGVVVRFTPRLPRPTWKTLGAPLRLLRLARRYDPRQWEADPRVGRTLARARELEARDVRAMTWAELLDTVCAAIEIPLVLAGAVRSDYFPGAALAMVRLRLMLAVLGKAHLFGRLLSGGDNETLRSNRGLEALAAQVKSSPELKAAFDAHAPEALWAALEASAVGRAFLAELEQFLDRYGHRETLISTALAPTWKQAPEVVLGLIKGLAEQPPRSATENNAWQAARDAVLRHPLLRLGMVRRAFLETLEVARVTLHVREDTHFYAATALPILRQNLLEMGRRLAEAGVLDAPEDVFHLKLDELAQLGNSAWPPADAQRAGLRAAMLRRRAARARLENVPVVDPRLIAATEPAGEALLRGLPGSPGVVEGPARVVRGSHEFEKLQAGDVLVAPYTNPAWTPLFQRAAAVVVDTGSAASHAAIVAREYGIPAVMSTLSGTQALRDGERVRVDGSQGAVFRAAPANERETASAALAGRPAL